MWDGREWISIKTNVRLSTILLSTVFNFRWGIKNSFATKTNRKGMKEIYESQVNDGARWCAH